MGRGSRGAEKDGVREAAHAHPQSRQAGQHGSWFSYSDVMEGDARQPYSTSVSAALATRCRHPRVTALGPLARLFSTAVLSFRVGGGGLDVSYVLQH